MRPNTQLTTCLALAVAFLAVSAIDAGAQEQLDRWGKVKNAEAQQLIDQGDELFGSMDYSGARAKYEDAVEFVRADGDFPGVPLYRIAASFYHEGKPMTAAGRLNALASESAVYGDIVIETWALADAAWIHGQAGNKLDMDAYVERVTRLLKSPYLPDDVREEITSKRLGEVTTLEQ